MIICNTCDVCGGQKKPHVQHEAFVEVQIIET